MFSFTGGKEDDKLFKVLNTASQVLIDYCSSLSQSEMTFKKFNHIKQHRQRFLDFMCIISPDDKATVFQTFNKRNIEYDLYKQASAIMNRLAGFLRNIPEKIGAYTCFLLFVCASEKTPFRSPSQFLIDLKEAFSSVIVYTEI